MKKSLVILVLGLGLIAGLPLAGILLSGRVLKPYLEFPPFTLYVEQAPFSGPVFIFYFLLITALLVPFVFQFLRCAEKSPLKPSSGPQKSFPWWGYFGIVVGLISWILAWNRFPGFESLQSHTFTPLWLAYIVVVNAFSYGKTGHCLLLDQPVRYAALFPLSSIFWWLFEFLNRFVQNWHYIGPSFSPWEYFWYATLPFSTVLPAVLGTRQWVLSFTWPERCFKSFLPIRIHCPRITAWLGLLTAGSGLVLLGLFPHYLFSLLWISPLIIFVSLQTLFGEKQIFSNITRGDWSLLAASAVAALLCGFFWEIWNFHSLAKWQYRIPFVSRFLIFEMPILGYAGYLPFGLVCSVVAELCLIQKKAQKA